MVQRFLRVQDPETGLRAVPLSLVSSVHLAPHGEGGSVLRVVLSTDGRAVEVARFELGQEFEALHALHQVADLLRDESVVLYEVGRFRLTETTWPNAKTLFEVLEKEPAAPPEVEAQSNA